MSESNGTEIDKEALYGNFLGPEGRRIERQNKLYDKTAHMALDIPYEDDDTRIDVKKETTNHNGIGTKGLIALAAAMAIPGLGGAYMAYQALQNAKPVKEVVGKVIEKPGKTTRQNWRLGDHEVIPPEGR